MFSKRITIILDFILKYFVRLNFNRKHGLFSKTYKVEFAIFFKKTDKYFKFLNGKSLQYTYKMYEYWLKYFNLETPNEIYYEDPQKK